jgi:hypothetical protein
MVTFEFYRDIYLGSAIAESKFPQLAQRAEAELARLKRCYRVEGGEEAQAMAVCAMAESLFACAGRSAGVQAATVGGVSVRYDDGSSQRLLGQLYRQAAIYLDIYRGR